MTVKRMTLGGVKDVVILPFRNVAVDTMTYLEQHGNSAPYPLVCNYLRRQGHGKPGNKLNRIIRHGKYPIIYTDGIVSIRAGRV